SGGPGGPGGSFGPAQAMTRRATSTVDQVRREGFIELPSEHARGYGPPPQPPVTTPLSVNPYRESRRPRAPSHVRSPTRLAACRARVKCGITRASTVGAGGARDR